MFEILDGLPFKGNKEIKCLKTKLEAKCTKILDEKKTSFNEMIINYKEVKKIMKDEAKNCYESKRSIIQNMIEQEIIQTQITSSVVTVELIKGIKLKPMNSDGLSAPYITLSLGKEKRKSSCKSKTLSPRWQERFWLRLHSNQSHDLKIIIWNDDLLTDELMGRCQVDLSKLEHEKIHKLCLEIEEGEGQIYVNIKISGNSQDKVEDLPNYKDNNQEKEDSGIIAEKYVWTRTLEDIKDVGDLQVKVFCAQGLAAKDVGGTSNPYCVLEMANSHLQTDVALKTLEPSWNKMFHFKVKDIHSRLEITVLDDDGNQKPNFLGKIVIPLLNIKNGERKWYVLKNKSLRCKAKGKVPEILLEFSVQWNLVRATVRSLAPREYRFKDENKSFKIKKLKKNIAKIKPHKTVVLNLLKELKSIWQWENRSQSILAWLLFLLTAYFFEMYMLPLALVLLFLKNARLHFITEPYNMEDNVESDIEELKSIWQWENRSQSILAWLLFLLTTYFFEMYVLPLALVLLLLKNARLHFITEPYNMKDNVEPDIEENHNEDETEKKRSPLAKFQEINRLIPIDELVFIIQEFCGNLSSGIEKCYNTFHFCVPFISWLLVVLLMVVTIVFYLIPLRYLIMMIGVSSFISKLVNSLRNQPLDKKGFKKATLAFISCIPDNEDLLDAQELNGGSIEDVNSDDWRRKTWNGTDHTTTVLRRSNTKT